jgi:hypothetical protein
MRSSSQGRIHLFNTNTVNNANRIRMRSTSPLCGRLSLNCVSAELKASRSEHVHMLSQRVRILIACKIFRVYNTVSSVAAVASGHGHTRASASGRVRYRAASKM